jgi:hypothetical protein
MKSTARTQESRSESLTDQARSFLYDVVRDIRTEIPGGPSSKGAGAGGVAEAIFSVLRSRQFTHLSKKRSEPFRETLTAQMSPHISAGRPLQFYFDIGGGYHAGIEPHRRSLVFEPGLGELLILRQIVLFNEAIRRIYAPGTRFSLVVDNNCALLVNDVPLHSTNRYCDALRRLIDDLGLAEKVDLFVESEHFTAADYAVSVDAGDDFEATPQAVENVSRFVGRDCDMAECRERMARYKVVSVETDSRISSAIDGARMTQRAGPSSFGFRAFPGSDSRIQSGEVVLVCRPNGKTVPKLVTSQSDAISHIECVDISDIVPLPAGKIGYIRSI